MLITSKPSRALWRVWSSAALDGCMPVSIGPGGCPVAFPVTCPVLARHLPRHLPTQEFAARAEEFYLLQAKFALERKIFGRAMLLASLHAPQLAGDSLHYFLLYLPLAGPNHSSVTDR